MAAGWQFWILACCVAFVQGGSQALSRSLFATLVPKAQASEFFGFFSFSSKIAGIIGPAIFGILGSQVGSSRISILSLVILFVAGIVILKFVDIEGGQALARAKDKEFHAK
jgi:UMF1 family MFS transporter